MNAKLSPTRQKMVEGAVDLLSRRGVHATSLRTVVQHTGTPRGSLSHHFPGGKQQLLEDAMRYAADSVAQPLEALVRQHGAIQGLRAFVGWWRRILEASGFEAGCPVLAVAVEPLTDDGAAALDGDRSGEQLRALAHETFERWESILAAALRAEGVAPARARRLAVLVVASIEGTVAMCRVSRSSRALDDVQQELHAILESAIRS